MTALRVLPARLDVSGLCLIVAMAGACSFDESQLQRAPTSTPDGAIEHPVVLDAGASGGDDAIAIMRSTVFCLFLKDACPMKPLSFKGRPAMSRASLPRVMMK